VHLWPKQSWIRVHQRESAVKRFWFSSVFLRITIDLCIKNVIEILHRELPQRPVLMRFCRSAGYPSITLFMQRSNNLKFSSFFCANFSNFCFLTSLCDALRPLRPLRLAFGSCFSLCSLCPLWLKGFGCGSATLCLRTTIRAVALGFDFSLCFSAPSVV